MNALCKPKYLPFAILGAGFTGLLLRVLLYTFGTDSQGLMPSAHPLHIACLLLAGLTAAYTALTVRKVRPRRRAIPGGKYMVTSVIFTCLWFLAHGFSLWGQSVDSIDTLRVVLSFCVIPCFGYTGYCLVKGWRASFLVQGIICLFFALDMICRYRVWSGDPQLSNYVFHLFACACLILAAYYRTAFAVRLRSPRQQIFFSLMACFFCMLAFVGRDGSQFYIGGALWATQGLGLLLPAPPQKPEES